MPSAKISRTSTRSPEAKKPSVPVSLRLDDDVADFLKKRIAYLEGSALGIRASLSQVINGIIRDHANVTNVNGMPKKK